MEEEEEKDNDDDILTKVTNFVDGNLRVFKVRQNFNFIGRGRRTIKGSSQRDVNWCTLYHTRRHLKCFF